MKNRVKEYREKRGLSQTALAEAVGSTKRTIYSIEVENKDIHLSLAYKLSSQLGCNIDDLFSLEDHRHTTADKAIWFTHIVRYVSDEIGLPIRDTIKLLEKNSIPQSLLEGYDVWHTQGYEYMAEMLIDELQQRQAG